MVDLESGVPGDFSGIITPGMAGSLSQRGGSLAGYFRV